MSKYFKYINARKPDSLLRQRRNEKTVLAEIEPDGDITIRCRYGDQKSIIKRNELAEIIKWAEKIGLWTE